MPFFYRKSDISEKISDEFFCFLFFLVAHMFLKTNDTVRKNGYFDFLWGGIQRCVYRQRGITNAERIANLRLLVQRPDPRSTATLDDLKNAILPNDHAMDVDHDATTQAASKDVQVSI